MLIWIFGTKSMECTSALHQPDGVGSQGWDIGSLSELNGVSIAMVARTAKVRALGYCGGCYGGLLGSRILPPSMMLDGNGYEKDTKK